MTVDTRLTAEEWGICTLRSDNSSLGLTASGTSECLTMNIVIGYKTRRNWAMRTGMGLFVNT